MKRMVQIVMATLREIFDESAYARFLQRNGMHSSRAAYTAFLRENEAARARRFVHDHAATRLCHRGKDSLLIVGLEGGEVDHFGADSPIAKGIGGS